jgi:pimeloyl-ACP methyl ester carboxylesterase
MNWKQTSEAENGRVREAQHVAVEGVRLAVRRSSPSAAPAGRRVLLLHGAGHTSAIWAPLIEELTSDRLVLAVDRRGYGDSEAAAAPVAQEARDYAALLVREGDEATGGAGVASDTDDPADDAPDTDALDTDSPDDAPDRDDDRSDPTDVVAEGDGVDVALALAALRPDLVARLVLVGGPRGTGTLAQWRRWTGRQSSPTVDAPAPDRALLIASAPKGAVPAQALMKALVLRADDPSSIRMVTLPGTSGAPLEAAPASVTAIVARFLREA